MKLKTMKRKEWTRLKECQFAFKTIDENTESGYIKMINLTAPLTVNIANTNQVKCIADNGYTWIQFGFRHHNLWLTAMFDTNDKLVECYFDITEKNVIKPNGDSYFYDLYLDVVFFTNGNIELLDEDELHDALNNQEISQNQYSNAYKTSKTLITWLENEEHQQQLIDYCYYNYFQFLTI